MSWARATPPSPTFHQPSCLRGWLSVCRASLPAFFSSFSFSSSWLTPLSFLVDVLDKTISLSKKPVVEVPVIRVDQSEESTDTLVLILVLVLLFFLPDTKQPPCFH